MPTLEAIVVSHFSTLSTNVNKLPIHHKCPRKCDGNPLWESHDREMHLWKSSNREVKLKCPLMESESIESGKT